MRRYLGLNFEAPTSGSRNAAFVAWSRLTNYIAYTVDFKYIQINKTLSKIEYLKFCIWRTRLGQI